MGGVEVLWAERVTMSDTHSKCKGPVVAHLKIRKKAGVVRVHGEEQRDFIREVRQAETKSPCSLSRGICKDKGTGVADFKSLNSVTQEGAS